MMKDSRLLRVISSFGMLCLLMAFTPGFAQSAADVSVEWPCRTRTQQIQDEYCEWKKATTPSGGLRCTYTSSFDSARDQFLTQKNRFNSKPFLIQLVEACVQDLRCNGSDCVPSRQADPAVCQAVTQMTQEGCGVAIQTSQKKSETDSSEKLLLFAGAGSENEYCQFVADPLTRALDRTLLRCDIPPFSAYKSCEQLAESIFVRAVLIKTSCQN